MKSVKEIIRFIWWLAVAYIPVNLSNLKRQFMDSIGCPPQGDCYVPGSDILIGFDVDIMLIALLLWPVCFWQVVVKPSIFFFKSSRSALR